MEKTPENTPDSQEIKQLDRQANQFRVGLGDVMTHNQFMNQSIFQSKAPTKDNFYIQQGFWGRPRPQRDY